MADICCGGCTRGRAGACFIREKSSLCSVHDHSTNPSCRCLAKAKGFCKDPLKNSRKSLQICQNNKERDQKVTYRHDRHHNVQYPDGGVFPQDDYRRQSHQKDRRKKRRYLKSILKGRGHRVSDHLADPAPADQAGRCE